jgi:hypothetical protein
LKIQLKRIKDQTAALNIKLNASKTKKLYLCVSTRIAAAPTHFVASNKAASVSLTISDVLNVMPTISSNICMKK